MEPTFAASTSETVTAELRAQLDAAVDAIPYLHATNPSDNEVFQSKEAAFTRLQDWAFINSFAIVKESSKSKQGQVVRQYLECVHHKKATKNELGSQAQPLEISSSDSDNEPRRSGRAKRSTRAVESEQWQVEHGLIPAPGAKAKARALNKRKKENTKTSQIDHNFRLL